MKKKNLGHLANQYSYTMDNLSAFLCFFCVYVFKCLMFKLQARYQLYCLKLGGFKIEFRNQPQQETDHDFIVHSIQIPPFKWQDGIMKYIFSFTTFRQIFIIQLCIWLELFLARFIKHSEVFCVMYQQLEQCLGWLFLVSKACSDTTTYFNCKKSTWQNLALCISYFRCK